MVERFHDWGVWGERVESLTGRLNGTLAEVSLDVADMRQRLLVAEAELLNTFSHPAAIKAVTGDVATIGTQLTTMQNRIQQLVDNVDNIDTTLTSDMWPVVQTLRRNISDLSSQLIHRMGSVETVSELMEGLEDVQKSIESLATKKSVSVVSAAVKELTTTVSTQHVASTKQTKLLNESMVALEESTAAKLARVSTRIDHYNTSLYDAIASINQNSMTHNVEMEQLATELSMVDQRLDNELVLVNNTFRNMTSTLDNLHIHLTGFTPMHVTQDLRTQIIALEDSSRTFATVQTVTNATNEMAFKLERQFLDRLHVSHAFQVI